MSKPKTSVAWTLVAAAMCAASVTSACAQLAEDQVLVVYDSRVPDSLAVAEYYAGSRKVPGGAGGLACVRPGEHVVNLWRSRCGNTTEPG